jgi:hypothetical protein
MGARLIHCGLGVSTSKSVLPPDARVRLPSNNKANDDKTSPAQTMSRGWGVFNALEIAPLMPPTTGSVCGCMESGPRKTETYSFNTVSDSINNHDGSHTFCTSRLRNDNIITLSSTHLFQFLFFSAIFSQHTCSNQGRICEKHSVAMISHEYVGLSLAPNELLELSLRTRSSS